MAKESFLLVSLKESKAKKLAQVVSNESCRKILDYLTDHTDATESELASKLEIPISTIHYNLKHLTDSGLLTAEEFHYSEKGKEVNHYKLANKYIIIAPKSTYGIKERLKSILPVGLIALATAGVMQIASMLRFSTYGSMKSAPRAEVLAAGAAEAAATSSPAVSFSNFALWFLLGALFTLALYFLIEYIKNRKNPI